MCGGTEMAFPSRFINESIKLDEKQFEIRCNLNTENDAKQWLNEYSEISKTNWIIKDGLYEPQKYVKI